MQRMIFSNINCKFTFKNLSPCLASFWSEEFLNSNETKIFVVLAIKTKHESYNIIDSKRFVSIRIRLAV